MPAYSPGLILKSAPKWVPSRPLLQIRSICCHYFWGLFKFSYFLFLLLLSAPNWMFTVIILCCLITASVVDEENIRGGSKPRDAYVLRWDLQHIAGDCHHRGCPLEGVATQGAVPPLGWRVRARGRTNSDGSWVLFFVQTPKCFFLLPSRFNNVRHYAACEPSF